MKKLLILTLVNFLTLFLFEKGFSQSANMHNGYILSLDQKKIIGELIYKDKVRAPEYITFKNGSGETAFTPAEISGFEIPGKVKFVSKKLRYSTNSHRIEQLTEDKEIIWEEKQVFAKVILSGTFNLYQYVDAKEKPHLVIETPENELIDLIELKYKKDDKVIVIPKYKNQLKRIIADCSELYEKIDKAEFKLSPIKAILVEYHNCMGFEVNYLSKKQQMGLEITTQLGFSSSRHFLNEVLTSDKSNFLSTEVNFEFILPKNYKVWSLIASLGYKSYELPLTLYGEGNERLNYLKMNLGLKRILYNRKLKVHTTFGFGNSVLIKKPVPSMRGHEQFFYFGIGASKNRINTDLRYEISNGYSEFSNVSTRVKTFYIMIGYILYKNEHSR